MAFQKAVKTQSKLRWGMVGPAGAGKTYSALELATVFGTKIAVVDTEHGSSAKYADIFDFDVDTLTEFHPHNYIQKIKEAESAGYEVLVIDSLSHEWVGKGGALELHSDATARSKSGNSYVAWKDVTPVHNDLIEAILQSDLHIIATMRAKTEYVQSNEGGRTEIRKVGVAPIQRDGVEYEFDVVAQLGLDHRLIVEKSRCSAIELKTFKPSFVELGQIVKDWLTSGAPRKVTQTEWGQIWNDAKQHGVTGDQFKVTIQTMFGTDNPYDLTKEQLMSAKDSLIQAPVL